MGFYHFNVNVLIVIISVWFFIVKVFNCFIIYFFNMFFQLCISFMRKFWWLKYFCRMRVELNNHPRYIRKRVLAYRMSFLFFFPFNLLCLNMLSFIWSNYNIEQIKLFDLWYLFAELYAFAIVVVLHIVHILVFFKCEDQQSEDHRTFANFTAFK